MNSDNKKCKIAVIVQARLGSTRLPGKILKEISQKPMLWHIVDRLSYSKIVDEIIVATTNLPEDDQVQEFCEMNNILFFRGSSENVLNRYFEAANKYEIDHVIRITADCPVIDPLIIDNMIECYLKESQSNTFVYLSNVHPRTFPRGLDTEIFSFQALQRAHKEATQQLESEHVTPFIYNHPELFKIKNFTNEKDYSFHRWTVDTKEDLILIKKIYDALYCNNKLFMFADILELFTKNPDLININQTVQQKKLGE